MTCISVSRYTYYHIWYFIVCIDFNIYKKTILIKYGRLFWECFQEFHWSYLESRRRLPEAFYVESLSLQTIGSFYLRGPREKTLKNSSSSSSGLSTNSVARNSSFAKGTVTSRWPFSQLPRANCLSTPLELKPHAMVRMMTSRSKGQSCFRFSSRFTWGNVIPCVFGCPTGGCNFPSNKLYDCSWLL